jgi:hypothetical protein
MTLSLALRIPGLWRGGDEFGPISSLEGRWRTRIGNELAIDHVREMAFEAANGLAPGLTLCPPPLHISPASDIEPSLY